MIAAGEFDAYNRASAELAGEAQRKVRQAISAFVRENPGVSAAEVRDFAETLLAGVAQAYGDAAASLAAEWYDELAEGRRLERAVIEQTYSAEQVDRVARYQARWLERGAYGRFARSCGEYAANHVRESLNRTMMRNVRRDRGRGVRFARVPTGAETCTFCTMLASRGAVYATARNAGEQNHYHRGCDCKIVPSFGDDAVVEGYDPRAYYEAWQEFERIDKMVGEDGRPLRKTERDRLKRGYLASHGMRSKAPAAAWRDLKRGWDAALEREAELAKSVNRAWAQFKRQETPAGYAATMGEFVFSFSSGGGVSAEYYAKPKAKELMAAEVLSKSGHEVVFLPELGGYGDKNPDARVDGVVADFKRIESSNADKIFQNIKRSSGQASMFVIDLRLSAIPLGEARRQASRAIASPETTADVIWLISSDGEILEIKS